MRDAFRAPRDPGTVAWAEPAGLVNCQWKRTVRGADLWRIRGRDSAFVEMTVVSSVVVSVYACPSASEAVQHCCNQNPELGLGQLRGESMSQEIGC